DSLLIPASGSNEISLPRMFWNGSLYAVLWYSGGTDAEVYFGFADATGHLDSSSVFMVSPSDGKDSVFPRLASSGTEYGLVYSDDRNSPRSVYFTRLTAAGAPIAGSETLIGAGDYP